MTGPVSVRTICRQATERLAITAQAASARRDAELLLRHVTGLSHADLLTHPDRLLSLAQIEAYFQAVERRANSEPIQYITGVQEFYGREFTVTPAVLIPRPETEHLVEAAIEIAQMRPSPPAGLRIADIGTGSGIIAITLALHLRNATIVATDISAAALAIARKNAAKHGIMDRNLFETELSSRSERSEVEGPAFHPHITFLQCDLLPPDPGIFDLICSNPPYVPSAELLSAEVAAYEPHKALFAGPDGLDIYRRLIPQAAAALRAGGSLLLEMGHGQQPAIESLLHAAHLKNVRFLADLQGIARVAIAERPKTKL